MFVQEMHVSKTKNLGAVVVVPAAQTVQVHSFAQTFGDVSQQSAHECEIIGINGDKLWHVVLVFVIQVSLVLLVNKSR